ncbi:hypothetical protein OROGR_024905 [Orobanche gracilis]
MEKDGVLIDVPACFLFEASGDSESQHFGGDSEAQHSDAAAMSAEEEDAHPSDDDVQSCNCGPLSGIARIGVDGDDDFRCADSVDFIGREEEDDHGENDLEDGVVDQCLGGRKASLEAAAKEKREKLKGCEDSSVKMMSEREEDRLFWEACLASHI